jgi:hypothetical protein
MSKKNDTDFPGCTVVVGLATVVAAAVVGATVGVVGVVVGVVGTVGEIGAAAATTFVIRFGPRLDAA